MNPMNPINNSIHLKHNWNMKIIQFAAKWSLFQCHASISIPVIKLSLSSHYGPNFKQYSKSNWISKPNSRSVFCKSWNQYIFQSQFRSIFSTKRWLCHAMYLRKRINITSSITFDPEVVMKLEILLIRYLYPILEIQHPEVADCTVHLRHLV